MQWSPDGTQLAFLRSRGTDWRGTAYVVSAARGPEHRLSTVVDVTDVAWSPTSSEIALVADSLTHVRGRSVAFSIRRVALRSRRATTVKATADNVEVCGGPSLEWQPGASFLVDLAASGSVCGRDARVLFKVEPKTGRARAIAVTAWGSLSASWSPRGDRIAFNDSSSLFIRDASGRRILREVELPSLDVPFGLSGLRWSGDGRVVFVFGWAGAARVDLKTGIIRPFAGRLRRFPVGSSSGVRDLATSADGSRVLLVTSRGTREVDAATQRTIAWYPNRRTGILHIP
jgi:dipeptidyl aminopeptidase/acylaminoacyl peptidase